MPVSIDLKGRNAIVTGGTRGIGRAISLRLAEAGARVAMVYRGDVKGAREALELLGSASRAQHFAISADLGDFDAAQMVTRQAIERFGGTVDIVVLNAGLGQGGQFADLSLDEILAPFAVNVFGNSGVLQAAYGNMRAGGSVVAIGSGAGHDPLDGLSAYGASKAALIQLMTVLAQEWGPKGVRVNIVSPGSTAKQAVDYENLTESQRRTLAGTALRRLGTAEDVADAVLYFASDLSGFVTGQWLRVNGGRV